MSRLPFAFILLNALVHVSVCQSQIIGFAEDFDHTTPPELPPSWSTLGFVVSTSAPHSLPNAVAATGNMGPRELTSPVIHLEGAAVTELTFWERRSSTAARYRLEVTISADDFQSVLARQNFDTLDILSAYAKRTVDLSSLGNLQLAVLQIRWRILPDSTNSTGVLRLDDVRLEGRPTVDLSLDRVEVEPPKATSTDPLLLGAIVSNVGLRAVDSYDVAFFLHKSDTDPGELSTPFFECLGPPLEPGGTVTLWSTHDPLAPGEYVVTVTIWMPGDKHPLNDTVCRAVTVGVSPHSIVINEIMYAPRDDEPEWFEIWNATSDSISLAGWTISDHTLLAKPILGDGSLTIPPRSLGVIAHNTTFQLLHPLVTAPILIAEFPPLNNASPDGPILKSFQGITIDSVRYEPSWGGQGGRSLERLDAEVPSTDSTAWRECVDPTGSTPGKENSTARLDYDVALKSINASDAAVDRSRAITMVIANVGRLSVPSHTVRLFDDSDNDEIPEEAEIVGISQHRADLAAGDSLKHLLPNVVLAAGDHRLFAVVTAEGDLRHSNDTLSAIVSAAHPRRTVIFNELMYEPLPGLCEWVELYNPTNMTPSLQGWHLADTATSSGTVNRFSLSSVPLPLDPGGYMVLAGDSTILQSPFFVEPDGARRQVVILNRASGLGLNNEGDVLVLTDASGATIDSLPYDPTLHHPYVLDVRGRSLERISPEAPTDNRANWSTAAGVRGGSPGESNTIGVAVAVDHPSVRILPNPFSPDGDGWEDFCVLTLDLPFTTASVRVRIYDLRGRWIRTLATQDHVGTRSQFIWDGLDNRGRRVAIGPYVVLVEAFDAVSGGGATHKLVVVVARKL